MEGQFFCQKEKESDQERKKEWKKEKMWFTELGVEMKCHKI